MPVDRLDSLLIALADQARNVPLAMREAGFTQDQISDAWTRARAARFTEPTGLGRDRLAALGKVRCAEVRWKPRMVDRGE